ncbi:hypothetical protein [Haploplasma axanthum]|uniref:DNA polymerase III delta' subunit n=1 Tax=Haploplasma axanthum TaxID=29552 RepID=A0A449BCK1_HAPAX|nr:hypothetical protein [Haploplasma axanthum]VEU80158.1 DNA polymerase III delta' subunit [Haploplasma axanthum]
MNKIVEFFENAHKKKRLSHLYLLSGEARKENLDLMYEIAYIVLKDFDLRDNLKELIKEDNHSQIYHIKPDGNVIKKDQIIGLQNEFTKTSLLKGPRIYIIEDVDLISTSAANSLLKFMEEPESNEVYGFLMTANLSNVLKTIISRSQVIRINASNVDIYDELIRKEIDTYVAKNISELTKSLEEANEYSEEFNIISSIEFIKSYMANWYKDGYIPSIELNKINGNIMYDRKYYKVFLEILLINFFDLWHFILKEDIIFNELEDEYQKQAKIKKSEDILKIIKYIQDEITKQVYYINISLSLEVLFTNIQKVGG